MSANEKIARKLLAGLTSVALLVAISTVGAQEVARFPIINAPPQTPGLGGAIRVGSDNYVGETSREDLIPLQSREMIGDVDGSPTN